ncbi:AcrR family transcriptional regulator [Streptomyces sp. SAI-135]|uniref:TetR/AcrR family transcriptional regulator n=1 Tax=unclassified Streptomyces TaxID=2593676 RepID=UPI002475BD31|nr:MULTISPECIES: TetR/AcrR family transcriptional regulator [unclassified Streptomyces]MDH6522719.1 AcrR family transcriptional regulator [Streptomyces sp. SAI-090]MDH6613665.1 AcrR family transcriptional regulator [Streptomyces sp. SAI-135]
MARESGSASAGAGLSSREVILNAARSLIGEKGYDGMAISDLSSKSGLPPSSIYYHFGNKFGVLAALLERTFEELHALFPNPSSFDGLAPLERLEAWFSAACSSLDRRPDYLRLLVAISVGPHKDVEAVQRIVRRIRDYAYKSWVEALTPIFASDGDEDAKVLVDELAVLGRAMTDGFSVMNSFDNSPYSSQVGPFVSLIRGLAAQRGLA